MIQLQNDQLKIQINLKGAELSSIYDLTRQQELLWQADENVWPWHAPNLFPVVGGCKNDHIHVDGIQYEMKRHGFARHAQFHALESSRRHAVMSTVYNDLTLQQYPYKFDFQLLYTLKD